MDLAVDSKSEIIKYIALSDSSTEFKEVTVTGVFSGQVHAVNMQKCNLNVINMVSADQIGKFPDSNIGTLSSVSVV